MARDCRNSWRNGKHVILGCTLLGWSLVLDWDHIWWAMGITDPINFSGIQGRPFHTVVWFAVWSIIGALVARQLESKTMVLVDEDG